MHNVLPFDFKRFKSVFETHVKNNFTAITKALALTLMRTSNPVTNQ